MSCASEDGSLKASAGADASMKRRCLRPGKEIGAGLGLMCAPQMVGCALCMRWRERVLSGGGENVEAMDFTANRLDPS